MEFASGYGAGIDILFALAILFAVWFVSEWWIRRRAAGPPRRLQMHLSTAIVMMIAAGGLMWANVAVGERSIEYVINHFELHGPWTIRDTGMGGYARNAASLSKK